MSVKSKILLAAVFLPLAPGVVLSLLAHQELYGLAAEALAHKDRLLATHVEALWLKQLLVIVLASALAIAAGMAVARSIVEPMGVLTKTARKVAKGDLSARSRIKRTDELGELAQTFDAMLPALERHLGIMQAMESAHQAQERLCPRGDVTLGRLRAAGEIEVSSLLGGDLFHIARQKNGLTLGVADVSGHGPAVGLLMALTKAYLTVYARKTPQTILTNLNRLLANDLKDDAFVTMAIAHITKNGEITAASAGHPPMFLWRNHRLVTLAETLGKSPKKKQEPPLGVFPKRKYSQFSSRLRPGESLTLLSDGLFELKTADGEKFIESKLPELLRRREEPSKTCALLLKAAAEAEVEIQDDMTVLIASA